MKFLTKLPKLITKKKRVGRGTAAGLGKTAGRGTKGQKSRTGFKIPTGFEGGQTRLYQRLPKLRGGGFKTYTRPAIVNLVKVNARFQDGERVSIQTLKAYNLIPQKATKAKIVGPGKLDKKLKFAGLEFSGAAYKAIYGKEPIQK